mmetsp:Transcript_17330/g.38199  ORF Transcript_17330/g.38199 Transcript_17330/m.38199 type:complete len:205 (+) Transcript_17330:539-1153(+)
MGRSETGRIGRIVLARATESRPGPGGLRRLHRTVGMLSVELWKRSPLAILEKLAPVGKWIASSKNGLGGPSVLFLAVAVSDPKHEKLPSLLKMVVSRALDRCARSSRATPSLALRQLQSTAHGGDGIHGASALSRVEEDSSTASDRLRWNPSMEGSLAAQPTPQRFRHAIQSAARWTLLVLLLAGLPGPPAQKIAAERSRGRGC